MGRGEGEEGDPAPSGVDDCRRKGRGDGRYRHTRGGRGRGSGGGVKGLVGLAAKRNYSKAAVVGRQCFSKGGNNFSKRGICFCSTRVTFLSTRG